MPVNRLMNRLNSWGQGRVLVPHRKRSIWLGVSFLAVAILIASATVVLLVTDRSVTDIHVLSSVVGNDDREEQQSAEASAMATAEAEPTPTPLPVPDPLPEDIELSARSAYVLHANSGTELFARNADEPLQPASTVKIFTALVVLHYASPDEVIEITEDDVVDPVAESSMGLQAGDRVTIHDLLVGLMLPSGNDAANALARTIGQRIEGDEGQSPEERFVDEMNDVARNLGLNTSVLAHAAGHDREGQVVTARELAAAAEALLERPAIQSILPMKHAEIKVGGENPRLLPMDNTNELLEHEEIYGVKTGTTVEAGQCLVAAYRDGDDVIIAVILGSGDRYGDARALLNLPEPPEPEDEEELDEDQDDENV